MKKIMLMVGVVLVTTGMSVQAAILVGYDFTDNANADFTAAGIASATAVTGNDGFSDAGVALTIGDTTNVAASGTTWGGTSTGSYGDTNGGIAAQNFADAVTEGTYMTFSFTADTPGTLNISNFSVSTARAGTRAPESYNILAQTNGGSIWLAAGALTTDQTTTVAQSTTDWFDTSIDLSGNATFQGIDSVEFRIYFYGANGATSSSRINIDNVLVEGTVVPEPTTFALLMVGLGSIFVLRRKKC